MLCDRTKDLMTFWKRKMGDDIYDAFLRALSMSLLRAKARFYVL